MFHHHETSLAGEFVSLSTKHFKTSTHPVDFTSAFLEKSLSLINSRIALETNGRIKEVLTKGKF